MDLKFLMHFDTVIIIDVQSVHWPVGITSSRLLSLSTVLTNLCYDSDHAVKRPKLTHLMTLCGEVLRRTSRDAQLPPATPFFASASNSS